MRRKDVDILITIIIVYFILGFIGNLFCNIILMRNGKI